MCIRTRKHADRELKVGGGRVFECAGCGTVGLEFGTTCLHFERAKFLDFVTFFENLDASEDALRRDGKLYVQIAHPAFQMVLSEPEMHNFRWLLVEGRCWLEAPDEPAGTSLPPRELSALVN